jgi:hypothetical protein
MEGPIRAAARMAIVAGLVCASVPQAWADDDAWIRLTEREGVIALESVARAYQPVDGRGPVIHLIGAVHIGDQGFYSDVQSLLDHVPVVLWEGVGGERPVAGDPALAGGDVAEQASTLRRARFLEAIIRLAPEQGAEPAATVEALAMSAQPAFAPLIQMASTDAWGNELILEQAETGVVVVSLGADGKPGGSGADADIRSDDHTSIELTEPAQGLQADLAKALGLEFQMDAMDYERAHWRNSDLNVDELRRAFRGEDVAARETPEAAASRKEKQARGEATGTTGADGADISNEADALLTTLGGEGMMAGAMKFMLRFMGSTPRSQASTKLMLAEILVRSEALMEVQPANMRNLMEVILDRRNDRVLYDLDQIRAHEPEVDQVAVFYGGGHLAGLAEGLVERGYEPAGELWIPAITIDLDSVGMTAEQAAATRGMIESLVQMSIPPAAN